MHFPLIFSTFLIYFISNSSAKLTVVGSDDEAATFSTFNFFQYAQPEYEPKTGVVLKLKVEPDDDGKCTATPADDVPAWKGFKKKASDYPVTIMHLDWFEAKNKCKLVSFSQAWPIVTAFSETLEPAGFPPSDILLISSNIAYKGIMGNPWYEPYIGRGLVIPDGVPPSGLNVVFAAGIPYYGMMKVLNSTFQQKGYVPVFEIEYEVDPWNALFMSVGITVAKYVLFAINVLGVLYYLVQLGLSIKRKEFKLDLRNMVFITDLLGVAGYSVTILLRMQTYAMKVTEITTSWAESIAFHMLLYLWSVFLMQMRQSRTIYVFRTVVVFGGLSATATTATTVIIYNSASSPKIAMMSTVVGYWIPFVQLLVAVTFAGFGISFYTKRKSVGNVSPQTIAALTRLGVLAMVAFTTYISLGITNMKSVTASVQSPGSMAAVAFTRFIAASIRGLALLSVLGLRVPKKSSSSSKTGVSTVGQISTIK